MIQKNVINNYGIYTQLNPKILLSTITGENIEEVTGLFIRNGQLHLKKEMVENIENPGMKQYVKRVEEQTKILRNVQHKKNHQARLSKLEFLG